MINVELYQGTSKGAEGYAARLTFNKQKPKASTLPFIGKMLTPPLQMR